MTIHDFKRKKQQQAKISMLTCYDTPSAQLLAQTAIDCALVGDSVAMTVHGHPNTLMATMEMMVLHTAAVARGLSTQFLISDLPFLSYRVSLADTLLNVKQLMQAGAHAVKLEGADPYALDTIRHIVTAGVPVMGHIGLTPQSVHQLGGHRVQGKHQDQAQDITEQALALEQAGCFALVLECIPQALAQRITGQLSIPTIGIGAGVHTDGQVLVWHDVLGLNPAFKPRFVKQYAQSSELMIAAIQAYVTEVNAVTFPTEQHVFN
jgi:3-methyl-2-oxobutanoate hydroxymethyltransferase